MVNFQVKSDNPKCKKLVEKLAFSGRRTKDIFQSIEEDDWYQQVYSEGANWSVYQILAHFVASEASIIRLIKIILQGNEGVPEGFDIDAFNEREVNCFAKLPNNWILQRFLERREETIQFLLALNDSDLAIEGRHPWLGVVPIEEMIKLLYRHNQIHQRDIRKVLAF
jgi:Uma2 family endonuclease